MDNNYLYKFLNIPILEDDLIREWNRNHTDKYKDYDSFRRDMLKVYNFKQLSTFCHPAVGHTYKITKK